MPVMGRKTTMTLSFKHLKHLGTAFLAVVVLAAVLPTWAAANSTQILQDVEQATLQAGAAPAISGLPVVKSEGQVATQTPVGIALAVPAGTITNTAEGTIVKGEGQSDVVFQNVGGGSYRASIHIGSPSDPERYEFTVKGAANLQKQFDGSLWAFGDTGQPVAIVEAPWAKDKTGKDVSTHYEIDGTTLVQFVSHQNGHFAYGITADPFSIPITGGPFFGGPKGQWHATKCGAAIVVAASPASRAFAAIKALGGARKVYNMTRKGKHAFKVESGQWAKQILGIGAIEALCF